MRLSPTMLRRLCGARALLCDVRDQPASIKQVASDVGISPFHFIRQFEAVFGATPHQYRIGAQIEHAKLLLATGSSVTEACMDVGFSSVGSFSHLFTRRVGISPSGYRRRVRTLVQVPRSVPAVLHPGCMSLLGQLPADAFRNSR